MGKKYVIDESTLTDIADAIRDRTCTAESIKTTDMASKILGIDEQFITDDSVAYIKNVPARALSYAEVTKIGGMTRKSENLIPYPYEFTKTTKYGVTFTLNPDRTISVIGTATTSFAFYITPQFKLSAGDYFLSGCPTGGSHGNENAYSLSIVYKLGASAADLGDGAPFKMDADYSFCRAEIHVAKNTVMNHTFKPMLNKGSTALPYTPPPAGLYGTAVTEVESAGANLLNQGAWIHNAECDISVSGDYLLVSVLGSDPYWFYYGDMHGVSSLNLPEGDYYFYSEVSGGAIMDLRVSGVSVVFDKGYFHVPKDVTQIHVELEGATFGKTYTVRLAIYKVQKDEYTPYFKHTLPIPVEVRGSENLFNKAAAVSGSVCGSDGNVYSNAEAFYSDAIPVVQGVTYTATNHNWYNFYSDNDTPSASNFVSQSSVNTFTPPSGAKFVRIVGNLTNLDTLMLNEGSTAFPYEPYGIAGLNGYGLGVSDTVYNYIDWEKKQFVKRCAMVDLGTLDWAYADVFGTHNLQFYANFQSAKYGGVSEVSNAICSRYSTVSASNIANHRPDKTIALYNSGKYIVITDTEYTDSASFKSAMSGVMLVYELATPVVTDISDLITDDGIIRVEAGGTITAKNELESGAPTTVVYQTIS